MKKKTVVYEIDLANPPVLTAAQIVERIQRSEKSFQGNRFIAVSFL